MTDGRDEGSTLTLAQLSSRFTDESAPVKVFTIAYGEKADPAVLEKIAEAARGSSVKGSAENIKQVYQDLGSFF